MRDSLIGTYKAKSYIYDREYIVDHWQDTMWSLPDTFLITIEKSGAEDLIVNGELMSYYDHQFYLVNNGTHKNHEAHFSENYLKLDIQNSGLGSVHGQVYEGPKE